MSAITHALKKIKQKIPPQILSIVYTDITANTYAIPISIDSVIRERIINEIVVADCNVISGSEVVISLNSANHERVEPGVHVYRIPKELTQHRSILSALSVSFSSDLSGHVGGHYGGQDEILNAAKKQLASTMSIQIISEARCSVIGENVVLVEHADQYLGNLYLRCIIEHDSNMNHISTRSWNNFATLCVLACKADIYNRSVIEFDTVSVTGGSEINAYRDIIERYSDADEIYDDFLKTKWSKTAIMNDYEMRDRLIRITSGNGY